MKTFKNRSEVALTRCCEASGAGGATSGCSRSRLASPVTCRSRRFESKAHGALHVRSTDGTTSHSTRLPAEELLAGHPKDGSQVAGYKLAKNRQLSRWSAQRTKHIQWVGEQRAPRNAAIELRSRFVGVFK
jgi:hypothetical protein